MFKTDDTGKINLTVAQRHFVSGDELFYNAIGLPTIPVGTITYYNSGDRASYWV